MTNYLMVKQNDSFSIGPSVEARNGSKYEQYSCKNQTNYQAVVSTGLIFSAVSYRTRVIIKN